MEASGGAAEPRLDIGELYDAYLPRVYAFALRMLGDEDAAADAAQETFAAAIASLDTFRGESSILTWILAIAKNRCLMAQRGRRERSFADIEAIVDEHAKSPSTEYTEAERRFYVEEVKEGCLLGLLQCLPHAQRCAFVLHLLNDLPIAEVGKILGKSDNSIRILVSRSRSALRSFLCRNCSLMSGSKCSCEGMIEFSLKRELIARFKPGLEASEVKEELRRFADELQLYRSLPEPEAAIARLLNGDRYRIFSNK
jgi:RNA polymerase sigma-70 factor, ECF subfamily